MKTVQEICANLQQQVEALKALSSGDATSAKSSRQARGAYQGGPRTVQQNISVGGALKMLKRWGPLIEALLEELTSAGSPSALGDRGRLAEWLPMLRRLLELLLSAGQEQQGLNVGGLAGGLLKWVPIIEMILRELTEARDRQGFGFGDAADLVAKWAPVLENVLREVQAIIDGD